jgi:hypothetical protein
LHSQDRLIKINCALDIGDGYYKVIDSVGLHCIPRYLSP